VTGELRFFLTTMVDFVGREFPRPDWRYNSLEALVLDQGAEHSAAKRPKGTRKRRNGQCYMNSIHLAWERGLTYVEGFACSEYGLPTLHAWCIDEHNIVVDPTWLHPERAAYIGVPILATLAGRWMYRNGVYGVLANDYRNANIITRTGSFDLPALVFKEVP
jgi:hypothetical protein